jgi:hypothetical protein
LQSGLGDLTSVMALANGIALKIFKYKKERSAKKIDYEYEYLLYFS